MILGIQLLGIFFAIALMYISYMSLKRRNFTINEYLFWTVVALGIIVASLFPNIFNPIVQTLSFKRTLDFLTVLGFLFLTLGLLYVYIVVRSLNRRLENLAMKMAMQTEKLEEEMGYSHASGKTGTASQKKPAQKSQVQKDNRPSRSKK